MKICFVHLKVLNYSPIEKYKKYPKGISPNANVIARRVRIHSPRFRRPAL